jgi:hypothetical protein
MWIQLLSREEYRRLPAEGKKLINYYDKGMFSVWSIVALGISMFFRSFIVVGVTFVVLLAMNIIYRRQVNRRG